ncbi:MAG TPA: hypothetical protein VHM70_11185, partial [Polyangiaceae bacterium]|nr:hypothetical protein [Polyangiaceae bacterium]
PPDPQGFRGLAQQCGSAPDQEANDPDHAQYANPDAGFENALNHSAAVHERNAAKQKGSAQQQAVLLPPSVDSNDSLHAACLCS